MENFYFANLIIGLLMGAILSFRSTNGGINRHLTKPLGSVVAMMVIWASVLGSVTYAGLIPSPATIKMLVSGFSGPWVCSPHLTASKSSLDERQLVKRRSTMGKNQEGEAQWEEVKNSSMELKDIDIDSITIPKHHPRSDFGNLETLQGSLRRDGMQEPVLVYEIDPGKYGVIDGVRRLKAALEMGWKQIPCLIKKGISEADAAHLSYVKNVERKTLNVIEIARHILTMKDTFDYTFEELELKGYGSTAAITNKLKLLDLPEKVQRQIQKNELAAGHGLELIKLSTKEEQERMAKKIVDHDLTVRVAGERIDRYLSKKRKEKKVRPKEIIPVGDVPGVYFSDSSDMREIPDKCVHLIVTSPPYHVGMEYEVGETFKEHLANVAGVMKECARVLVPGGIIAINVSDIINFKGQNGQSDNPQIQLVGNIYQSCLKKYGVYLTDDIIWAKRPAWGKNRHVKYKVDTPHVSYRIFNNWEHVFIFRKKGEREIPSEEIALKSRLTQEQWITYVNGVWAIETVNSDQEHPCVYPDELVNRIVRMFSYVGDTVLDPMCGSGTSVAVARELGREGIGYERELQYKATIMRKLGMPFEDTLQNVQQTLKADNWAPDLSVNDSLAETGDDQEAEDAVAEIAEAGLEA